MVETGRLVVQSLAESCQIRLVCAIIKTDGALAAFAAIWIMVASLLFVNAARGRTYANPAAIPKRHVGLVLGCSRVLPDGRRNLFFENRIRAAKDLFRTGKVDYLVRVNMLLDIFIFRRGPKLLGDSVTLPN